MSGLNVWLRCLGRAVCAKGAKALETGTPFGERLPELAGDFLERLRREAGGESGIAAVVAEVAAATECGAEAEAAASEAAADRPATLRGALSRFLRLAPAVVRAALRRPTDPAGMTLPPEFGLRSAEDVLPLLAPRPPRFRPGDRAPGGAVLVELLGVGETTEVWKARPGDPPDAAPVVLKLFLDFRAAEALRRCRGRLAQVMGPAQHPGIVALRAFYLEDDPVCLEYEYAPAGDLAGAVRDGKGLAPAKRAVRAARLVLRLARAVGQAHRLDPPLVHRDLKASNVLALPGPGGELDVRVADFGSGPVSAARALDRERRKAGPAAVAAADRARGRHSPLYASPQQARGKTADPRDDVFALGVLWYQLLTGDPGARPAGKHWSRGLPEDGPALALLRACCDRDAGRRPADAATLAERLAAVLATRGRSDVLTVAVRDGDHVSIAAAVRAAPPGALIQVRPGTYSEAVVLDKPVEIVGDDPADTVLDVTGAACLVMRTDDATVRRLSLRCRAGAGRAQAFAVDVPRGRLVLEDCVITCDSLACVGVYGAHANPTLRRCTVRGGREAGVFVFGGGKGRFDDCSVVGHRLSAVEVKTGGNPLFRRCVLRGSTEGSGVYVYEKGRGTFEDCDIAGHARSGVRIKEGGDPTFRRCRVRDGQQSGVFVTDSGRGTFQDCEIAGHQYANVEVASGGDPVVRGCKIHGGQQGGIFAYARGRGMFAGCDVYANRLACVEVKEHADPVVRNCVLRDSVEGGGFFCYDEGRGTLMDCDVHGGKCAGLEIRNKAAPVIRGCKVHHSRDGSGAFVWDHACGTIEDCEFFANKLAGLTVRQGADPLVRRCTVRENGEGGLFVYQGGKGTFEDCDICGNRLAGVEVREESDPLVRRCRIRDGQSGGLFVYDRARGRFEECEVRGHRLSNVEVKTGGDPTLLRCELHAAATNGVYVYEKGKGTLEGCTIADNELSALRVQQEGEPTLRGCRLCATKQGPGVLVQDGGRGTLLGCELTGNAEAGLEVRAAGDPLVRNCRIGPNAGCGVRVHTAGKGTVADCDLTGNARGPWSIGPGGQVTRTNNRE